MQVATLVLDMREVGVKILRQDLIDLRILELLPQPHHDAGERIGAACARGAADLAECRP